MKKILIISSLCLFSVSYGQVIGTEAGTGTQGSGPYSGNALTQNLNDPFDVAVDANGNIYFSDQMENTVFRVDKNTGEISNYFGNGTAGEGTSGEPGPEYELQTPTYLHIDDVNEYLYVCDHTNNKIFKMDMADSSVYTVAGTGVGGYSADGSYADTSPIDGPMGIDKGPDGLIYFIEQNNYIIRRINLDGTMTTVAGTVGTSGSADGTSITAQLYFPMCLKVHPNGSVFFGEPSLGKIRMVSGGTVSTYAGTGSPGFNGDGLSAINTQFNINQGFEIEGDGNVIVSDYGNNRVRKIDPSTTIVSTIAGNGTGGYTGDGGDPLNAELHNPMGIVVDGSGNLFWAEIENSIIRSVTTCNMPTLPTITLLSGEFNNVDSTYCPGVLIFQIANGDLNDAADWEWYENNCGGTPYTTGGTINYILFQNTTLSVRGIGNCVTDGPCQKITLNIGDCSDPVPPVEETVNAFSPNNDGVNDGLFIQLAEDYPVNTVYIYNRWGDVIRTIPNYNNITSFWDGKDAHNFDVGVGTYFYIFESGNIQEQNWVNVVK